MSNAYDTTVESLLTDETRLLRSTVREFAEKEIRPVVMKYDEAQEFPLPLFRRMGELGLLGATIPASLGGAGLSPVESIVIMEEISRVDPSLGLTLAGHTGLCLQHLSMFVNEAQAAKYIPPLASGAVVGSWCLTEPGSGSDASGMRTVARREGDAYIIDGTKTFITNGSHASTFVVTAKTDPSKGRSGISAFIVERAFGGISIGRKENKLGMRASDTAQVIFDHVRVPAENLLGAEGEGYRQTLAVLESGRVGIAALSVGLAQGAFEAARAYAHQRQQFGKPIAEFQAIQFQLAEMATEIQAARLLTLEAAQAKARGEAYGLRAAQAKLYASEIAQRVATAAVQIHGGYGFTKDFPVEKFYRDVKLLTIGEGTSEVQKIVIAKHLVA